MAQSRVIGAEHIQDAYQRGRIVFEVLLETLSPILRWRPPSGLAFGYLMDH